MEHLLDWNSSYLNLQKVAENIKITSVLYQPVEIIVNCPWQGLDELSHVKFRSEMSESLDNLLSDFDLVRMPLEFDNMLKFFSNCVTENDNGDLLLKQSFSPSNFHHLDNILTKFIRKNNSIYEKDFLSKDVFDSFASDLTVSSNSKAMHHTIVQAMADLTGSIIIIISSCQDRLLQTIEPIRKIKSPVPFFMAHLAVGGGKFIPLEHKNIGMYFVNT